MTLQELIGQYEEHRTLKAELEDQVKANNAALAELEEQIADYMIEEDTPQIAVGGYSYSLKQETKYNFKGADKLAAAGLDKFDVLRENGFDFLIKETVDPRTLNSTMKEQANTEEGIPDEVMEILSTFDVIGINRRKATSRVKKEGR
jgi:hypothetical protein